MESTPQTKKQQKNKTKNDTEYKRAGKGVRAIIKNQEKNKIVKK
jgi:hypothetical protein